MSFARGLNDTPKIAALLLGAQALPPSLGIVLVAVAIAIGGILMAWVATLPVAAALGTLAILFIVS